MITTQPRAPFHDASFPQLPTDTHRFPSKALVIENLEQRQTEIGSVLLTFSRADLFKLALVISPTVDDLLFSASAHLRDLLWIELRAAFSEDPILLTMTLGHEAADPDNPENLSLVHRIRNLNLTTAQSLGWVISFLGEGGIIETLQSRGGLLSPSYGTPFWKMRRQQRNDGRRLPPCIGLQGTRKPPIDVRF
jgi:hypothetical protein